MAPKQKQAKKGPAYKPATASKDIVPTSVKQAPRQPRPIKIPQNFPQLQKNNQQAKINAFQQWPSQQTVKAFDFGLTSHDKFNDPFHKNIQEYIKNDSIFGWKGFYQIASLREQAPEESQQDQQDLQEKMTKSLQNFEYVDKTKQKEQENPTNTFAVIQTFKRMETQQEMQRRKKQEAQKAEKNAKDKKKGKKQQPKDEGPLQVSDVKMADIQIRRNMCKQGIWIGSQLQIIKQRELVDVYNNQQVWKKIYPQENGVPVINKSGKYWVKLYYMGKQVKVEVDDRVPINCQIKQLFPLSQKTNQKWTLILTKAVLKLIIKTCPFDKVVGNGMVLYALTGMISQKIPLNYFNDWQRIQNFMGNNHYLNKDIVVNCFSDAGKSLKSQSNYIRSVHDLKNFIMLQNSNFKSKNKRLRKASAHEISLDQHNFKETYMQNQVLSGHAYCIGDYFQNKDFNMVFSQEKTQKQMRLRLQYNQLAKVSLGNKGRQQKLQHRKKKKQVKQKLANQQKKRSEMIEKPTINYHFFKILSDVKIHCEYSQKQILLAKKCVLNNLQKPPNYDVPFEKQQKQLSSQSISLQKTSKELQIQQRLDDFSEIQNAQQLLQRKDQGIWIKSEDLLSTFEYLQILYNPNIFQNKTIINTASKASNTFTYDQNQQILLVQKYDQKIQGQQNLQIKPQRKIDLLFGFAWQSSQWDTISKPYCMVQKFDFESFVARSNSIVLRDTLSSKMLSLKNQNSVFKLYTMAKGNYTYWISSSSKIKTLSIADYLTQYQSYGKKNFTIDYASMQAMSYSTLMRLKITQSDQNSNTILLKLTNAKEDVLKILNYRILKVLKKKQEGQKVTKFTSQQQEGIVKKSYQNMLMAFEYSRIVIQPQFTYYVILEAYPGQNIPQGSLQMIILNKNQGVNIEQIEQVQPVKYVEKYQPNKYGVILKQKIYTNNDNNLSFSIKIVQGQQGQPLAGGGGGKAAKKGGKQQAVLMDIIQKPLQQKRKITVSITKGQQIIYKIDGVNQINITGITLESTKINGQGYYIQANFDLKDFPEAASQQPNESTSKLYWVIQIQGQDSIALVRDTMQEQRQKETRKSWEDQQPGRAQKAKKSRRKFLILMKKQNGQELTQEQIEILNAPRLTKKQQAEEDKKNEQKKGKGGKKQEKKAGKDAKKEQPVEQKVIQRDPPKSSDNFMTEIRNFLLTLQNCNVKYQALEENQQPIIRSQEQLQAIKQGALMAQENRATILIRNIGNRQTMKIKQKQKKQSLDIFFSQKKAEFKQKWSQYIQWRIQDQQKQKSKQQKQKALVNIINQQKPTISETDLKKIISQYQQIPNHNAMIAGVADMVRKNIRISVLTQKINGLLSGWEIDQLKNISAQIINQKIQGIQEQVMKNMNIMLEEVAKNPGIVAQKQAQAKKAKKGGKK